MVVFKFGGTSVQDVEAMNQVLDVVSGHIGGGLLVVSSAMAGVTNNLDSLTHAVRDGRKDIAEKLLLDLETRHSLATSSIKSVPLQKKATEDVASFFRDIRTLVKGSFLLGECSARVSDAILGTGELLATQILYALAKERGFNVSLLDARKLIVTDERFGEANVIWPTTQEAIKKQVLNEPNKLWIVQGFIGATTQGVATTLGRGGSDYSASLFGAALDAERIEIWTDVDGIMTTDPRKVKTARSIPVMTYAEAAELAFFGAKVVHPATIQPAVEKDIPVLVKNTKNPTHPGTTVCGKTGGVGVRAIAGRKGVTLITVTSSRMLMAYGFLKRIFTIFDGFETSVDLVATSEVSVSMTINGTNDIVALRRALEELGVVRVEENTAILSLVGQGLWKDGAFLVRVFRALEGLQILLVSMGSSEINLSLVVRALDLDKAVDLTHAAFFDQDEA